MPAPYRIGIVGFGVAGASAAYLLARAGHAVTLLERALRVGPVGAGILLQPSGQMILGRMGLLDKVIARGEPIDALTAQTPTGRRLTYLPYPEIDLGCRAYGLHRGDLFDVLHDAVRSQPVDVRLGCEIRSCRVAGGGVHVASGDGREHGPFDFLLAADGSNSRLRACCNVRRWVHEYAYGTLWVLGKCEAVRNRLHQVVRGTTHLAGIMPMGGGRCSFYWGLRGDAREALQQRGFPAWRDEVLRFCPPAEEVFEEIDGFEQVPFTSYRHVWMRSWHDGPVLFLGDAAHAMSPHLGQGINFALLDAQCFADALAAAPDYLTAFRAYCSARRRHLRFYATVTFLLTPFFQSDGLIKGWGRDVVLPVLPRVPLVRRQMLLAMAGLKKGFLGGRMVI